jgi:hypothetical protein
MRLLESQEDTGSAVVQRGFLLVTLVGREHPVDRGAGKLFCSFRSRFSNAVAHVSNVSPSCAH